jgi:hypothetical protein
VTSAKSTMPITGPLFRCERTTPSRLPTQLGSLVVAITFVFTASACHESGAIKVAAAAWSCPKDQITLVSEGGQQREPPPPEVAADPKRLAVWQGQADPEARTYVVTGCGHTGRVSCAYATSGQYIVWTCEGPPSIPESTGEPEETGPMGVGTLGATVIAVRPASPAANAGLVKGDLILEIDNQSVGDGPGASGRIVALVRAARAGGHTIRVQRGTRTLDLTLGAPDPGSPTATPPAGSPGASGP